MTVRVTKWVWVLSLRKRSPIIFFLTIVTLTKKLQMCIFCFTRRILPQIISQSYLTVSISCEVFSMPWELIYIRSSACSNLVSKSIQITTLIIIRCCSWCWPVQSSNFWIINQMIIGTFPEKKILSLLKGNTYFMGLCWQYHFLVKLII